MIDVIGSGPATTEDLGVQPFAAHLSERLGRRGEAFVSLLAPLVKSRDVLRTAVVAEHTAKSKARQLVHELCQRE